MSFDLLFLGAFVCGTSAAIGVSLIYNRFSLHGRVGDSLRLHEEFLQQGNGDPKSPLFKNLSKIAAESAADLLQPSSLCQRFTTMIDQADLRIRPASLLIIAAATGLGLAAAGGFCAHLIGGHILVGTGIGLLGAVIPIYFVYWKRKTRLEKMLAQLPDALDLMVTVMKAGRTMTQAMHEVADHFKPPISTEFNHCIAQQDLGLHPEAALRSFAHRTGLLEIKIFVLTLLIQRQSGGNFAELLERLAEIIRQRFRVRGQVRTLTAEGRLQAITLIALAPSLFLVMMFLNQRYTEVLLQRPDLLTAMIASMTVGALWIRRIVNFEF